MSSIPLLSQAIAEHVQLMRWRDHPAPPAVARYVDRRLDYGLDDPSTERAYGELTDAERAQAMEHLRRLKTEAAL